MFFPAYGLILILTLLLSTLSSSSAAVEATTQCHRDDCLHAFEQHAEEAKRYCASHPNPWYMAPAPSWAGDCHSLGRFNNKRMRLASACECFYRPSATAMGDSGMGVGVGKFVVEPISSVAERMTGSTIEPTSAPDAEIKGASRTEERLLPEGKTSTSSAGAAYTR